MADEGEGMGVGGECEGELGAMAGCSEGKVRAVAGAAAAVLVGAQREDAALDGPVVEHMEVDLIKALYSALACVFEDVAKRDASAEALVAFMRGKCGVPEAQAGVAREVYAGAKERLRCKLGRTGEHNSIARLKGVDWRLEYRIEDSSGGDAAPWRDLLYHVVLKMAEKADTVETNAKTAFVCSVEQLHDLILTLKDACRPLSASSTKCDFPATSCMRKSVDCYNCSCFDSYFIRGRALGLGFAINFYFFAASGSQGSYEGDSHTFVVAVAGLLLDSRLRM